MSVLYKIAASPLSLLAVGVFLGIAVYMALTGRGVPSGARMINNGYA